jgi:hypothetical protein
MDGERQSVHVVQVPNQQQIKERKMTITTSIPENETSPKIVYYNIFLHKQSDGLKTHVAVTILNYKKIIFFFNVS